MSKGGRKPITIKSGSGLTNGPSVDSHVAGLTTDEMKGTNTSALSITYYTAYTDSKTNTSSTAATLAAALNGGSKMLGNDYTFMSWKKDSSINDGYPVLYTPSPSGGDTTSGGGSTTPTTTPTTTTGGATTAVTSVTASPAPTERRQQMLQRLR